MSQSPNVWLYKDLDSMLTQNQYDLRKRAKKKHGKFKRSNGLFVCLSLLKDGKPCRTYYTSEQRLQEHVNRKHCILPGKENPNEISTELDDDIEEIEEITTEFTVTNGVFKFIDE